MATIEEIRARHSEPPTDTPLGASGSPRAFVPSPFEFQMRVGWCRGCDGVDRSVIDDGHMTVDSIWSRDNSLLVRARCKSANHKQAVAIVFNGFEKGLGRTPDRYDLLKAIAEAIFPTTPEPDEESCLDCESLVDASLGRGIRVGPPGRQTHIWVCNDCLSKRKDQRTK